MYTLPTDAIASSIIFTQFLDTSKDIVISFDYACYGPAQTGSEGFCVFFTNTFAQNIAGGGPGPGLGYATTNGVYAAEGNSRYNNDGGPVISGISQGILGIGFDITGNFGSNLYLSGGSAKFTPNSITLRADQVSNFNFITQTPDLRFIPGIPSMSIYQQVSGTAPTYKRVRIRMTDYGSRIIVDMKNVGDLNFVNYLNYSISLYNNTITYNPFLSSNQLFFPSSLWCGLAFTTGLTTNTTFKIKNFNINGNITSNIGNSSYTYYYAVDTTTLSATFKYLNTPALFSYGDTLSAVDTYDGVNPYPNTTTNPAITANPLIIVNPPANAAPGSGGAPYQSGDSNQYLIVTPR